jgi:F0F1-type ATP synthase assembly protein I
MTTSEDVALSPSTDRGVDLMLAVAIQFVVAIAVWGGIGLVLDLLLPTAPWLQFTGIMLGTAIGLVLAQRRAVPPPSNGDLHG